MEDAAPHNLLKLMTQLDMPSSNTRPAQIDLAAEWESFEKLIAGDTEVCSNTVSSGALGDVPLPVGVPAPHLTSGGGKQTDRGKTGAADGDETTKVTLDDRKRESAATAKHRVRKKSASSDSSDSNSQGESDESNEESSEEESSEESESEEEPTKKMKIKADIKKKQESSSSEEETESEEESSEEETEESEDDSSEDDRKKSQKKKHPPKREEKSQPKSKPSSSSSRISEVTKRRSKTPTRKISSSSPVRSKRSRSHSRSKKSRSRSRSKSKKSRSRSRSKSKSKRSRSRSGSRSRSKRSRSRSRRSRSRDRRRPSYRDRRKRDRSADRKHHGRGSRSHRSHRSRSRDRRRRSRSRTRRKRSKSRDRRKRRHPGRRSRSRSRSRRHGRSHHRRRSRSRSPLIIKPPPKKPLTYKEALRQKLIEAQKQAAEGKLEFDPLGMANLTAGSEKPSALPLMSINPLMSLATGPPGGEKVTPQQALLQTMAAMHQKAQQITGVAVPKYYNPAAVNPLKYAEQIKKRKLLWSKKDANAAEVGDKPTFVPVGVLELPILPPVIEPPPEPTMPGASVADTGQWKSGTAFIEDKDGKMEAKFRKLMGIKQNEEETNDSEETIKKQQDLFTQLDREYQFARMTTHTHRGIGLGFTSQMFPENNTPSTTK